jgi:type IV fimbrial biogenesis protein FimT
MSRAARRCFAGFTLIEMLVVVAVIAILSTVAMPSFTGIIARHRAKAAASDLHITLMKTRSEALKRNVNVKISPDAAGWQKGWRILDETSTGCSAGTPCVIDNFPEAKGVTITLGPTNVLYQSSGRIQGTSAPSFLVTSSAIATVQRCVSASTSGRPYVKEGGTCP